jgi:hypothetical protein
VAGDPDAPLSNPLAGLTTEQLQKLAERSRMEITPQIRTEAQKELARRVFFNYCQLKYPSHYTDDRVYLADVCHRIQAFVEQNEKRFLVINTPPRHSKSFTGTNLVEWYFGREPHPR